METVEGVEATANTLTLPVRRRRRAARGGERQSVTSLRRSAILEAIEEPRGPPPPPRKPPGPAAAAAARGLEIGMWAVVASESGTNGAVRERWGAPRAISTSGFGRLGFADGLAWMPLGRGPVFMSLSTPGMTVSPLRFHSHLLVFSTLLLTSPSHR